jgi:hypothetical protein
MKGFISTRHSKPSLKKLGSTKAAGANVKGSRLNEKGDMYWRGKRGGEAMMGKSKKAGY